MAVKKDKRIQTFVNRYYETMRTMLLVTIAVLTVFSILQRIEDNNRLSEQRTEAVTVIADAIKHEAEEQTKIINRQFRALCIIVLSTSGQEGLQQLDDETREQCENLADDPSAMPTRQSDRQQDQSNPQNQPNPSPQSSSQTPQRSPQASTEQPSEPTPEPQPSLIESITRPINNLIERVL